MTRPTPLASAEIPYRQDVVVFGWAYTASVFLLAFALRLLLVRGDARFNLAPFLWLASIVLAIFLAAVVAFRLWRRARIELTRDVVRYEGHAGVKTLPVSGIVRLGLVEFGKWSKIVSIETASDRILLTFLARRLAPGIEAVLEAVAARTGLAWKGRRAPAEVSGRAGFLAFVHAWRAAVGGSGRRMARWIATHSLVVRLDEVAVNSVFLRWAHWMSMAGFAFFVLLAVYPAQFASEGRETIATWIAFGLLGAGWLVSCLGFNLVVLFLDREVRTRESIETELEAAREVQQRLLPAADPELPWLEVSGSCDPAREVGGDYFDYFQDDGRRVVVAIADVAGKGLPAALLMTLVKGALAVGVESLADVREAAVETSRHIRRTPGDRRFVTLALAELTADGRTRLVRAGHLPPLRVRRDGSTEWLAPRGLALGLGRDGRFGDLCELAEVPLAAGELLVFYTDGVTETLDPAGEEYGEERLRSAVTRLRERSCREIREEILEDLAAFRGAGEVTDDVTLVVARRH